jgi:2-oxoisovalerate dehydrogenase E1 component alpha subunit
MAEPTALVAVALGPKDWLVPALREAGAGIYRGLPMRTYVAQIFGNNNDVSKGRQLPCHPGTRASRYLTMSSCIATQLPHAMGMAWAAKLSGDTVVVLGCLGDGASSEEDWHVAANFAGVFAVQVVFFCQNNQWAISEPIERQTRIPLYQRALGFGFPGLRVDGNDVLATYAVTQAALQRAREGSGPTFIEAYTYRMGAHTTSDDPTKYRLTEDLEHWKLKDPIERVKAYLSRNGVVDDDYYAEVEREADELAAHLRQGCLEMPDPSPLSIFDQVYEEITPELEAQRAQFAEYLSSFASSELSTSEGAH